MRNPTLADLRSIADQFGFSWTEADQEGHLASLKLWLQRFGAIDSLPMELPKVAYPGRRFSHPDPEQNPLGAWWVRTQIERAASGKLQGRTIAIKDNIFVAEIPLMNGSEILRGYVPPIDATIVTRILEAGGKITGKSVCEAYCMSGAVIPATVGPSITPTAEDIQLEDRPPAAGPW